MFYKKIKFESVILITILLFLSFWSVTYYIHSSELWSVYISKNLFDPMFIKSVSMKPLLNLFLFLFHLFPLTNIEHLIAVKIFFGLFGIIQFYLLWKIFLYSTPPSFKKWSVFLILAFALFLFSSETYLQNFFRIRSDQICVSLFLCFVYLNLQHRIPLKFHFLFIGLYPLIALKGLLFSSLHLIHLALKNKAKPLGEKNVFLYTLALCAALITTVNFSWNGVLYLISTFDNFSESLSALKTWAKADAVIITLSLVTIFHLNYQRYIKEKIKINLSLLSIISLIVVFLFPQKHTYFIASFIPIFALTAATYICYLYDQVIKAKKYIYAFTFVLLFLLVFKYQHYYQNNPYRSNLAEYTFIKYISEIISRNNLSYIDGFGALPRSNNLNCFVSPNDEIANQFCVEQLNQAKPDLVILTARLMNLVGTQENLKKYYQDVGYNIFINKDFKYKFDPPKEMLPALLVFGFEH